jgi:hypothetical protein
MYALLIPALPYDPGEQGDPLHAEAPAERELVGQRHMTEVICLRQ